MAGLRASAPIDLVAGAEILARSIYERVVMLAQSPDAAVMVPVTYVEVTALVNILTAARASLSCAPEGATLQ